MSKELTKRQIGMLEDYINAKGTTVQIAKRYGTTTRTIQRLANDHGVIRTRKERWWLSRKHWEYKKLNEADKKKRLHLSAKKRYRVLAEHPYCTLCGAKASASTLLQVDHIDLNPSNNADTNLQVLCHRCNVGKGGYE